VGTLLALLRSSPKRYVHFYLDLPVHQSLMYYLASEYESLCGKVN
jgi:hypothetical protein